MGQYELTHRGHCGDPDLKRHLVGYCFGEITEQQKQLFEAHLLECNSCWQELERLHHAVRALQSDRTALRDLRPGELAKAFGISSEVFSAYSGHTTHVYIASVLYALNFIAVLFLETAYQFNRLGTAAAIVAVPVFGFIFGTSIWIFRRGAMLTARGKPGVGWTSVQLVFATALLCFAGLCLFLPNQPVTLTTTQSYTAQVDYLKDLFYLVPVAAVFLILPLHFVVSMQREMAEGKHPAVLNLLSGQPRAVPPRGTVYPRSNLLWIAFFGIVIFAFGLTWRLLDTLQLSVYMHLYSYLIVLRLTLYFGLWFECLLWYNRMLNEIKRECLAMGH